MTTKNIKGRIQHKHDVEANWQLATNFIPMIGELIVYDPDTAHEESRLKIGDGQTLVNDLPFAAVSLSDFTTILDDYAKIEDVPTKVSQLENDSKFISEDYVEAYFKRLNSDNVLRFYCIEDVTVVINGVSTVYPANSNVEVKFLATDVWEVVPTSDNSILALNAFPGALGTYYSWLEGVKQFSNILFDMNNIDMYSKWSQGHQGEYKVQFAQYLNCIFWSDNPYISDVNSRTNYTLYYSSQLPLCYSSIPDNTFKSFYLALSVNSDPNWSNEAYRNSFAKATWATQVFSYYGARTIGIFGHDNPKFNIVLPKDCRGLMYAATSIENAGNFDATNVTNFGAKSGSWRDAFGYCSSLRNLYIKNLKVNLNISWSPIEYDSISYIIDKAANTDKITISVSPYTYNLLKPADFELATSKNIIIELITTNYVEDRRLSAITINGDGTKVLSDDGTYKTLPTKTSQLENDSNFSKIEGITSAEDKITIDRPIIFEGSTITSDTKATTGGLGDSSNGYHSEYSISEEDLEYKTNNGFYLTSITGYNTYYEDEACTTAVSTIFVAEGGSTPIYLQSGPSTSSAIYIELEEGYGTIYFKDGNGESFSFKFAKITPETNIPSDITDLKSRVSSLESNSGGSSNIGGAYYVCAPLVNAQYYSPNPNWFLVLPPQDSCSKIVLKSVRYVYQPKNNQPYTSSLTIDQVLYEKDAQTSWYGNIDYSIGMSDGSGTDTSISIYFSYYGNEFGCYDTNIGDDNDNYACLKTSYFVFEITP